MERLGESCDFGEVLLEILEAAGWQVYRKRAFAGDGVLLIAAREAFQVSASGPTVAAASTTLFTEAATYYGVKEAA